MIARRYFPFTIHYLRFTIYLLSLSNDLKGRGDIIHPLRAYPSINVDLAGCLIASDRRAKKRRKGETSILPCVLKTAVREALIFSSWANQNSGVEAQRRVDVRIDTENVRPRIRRIQKLTNDCLGGNEKTG